MKMHVFACAACAALHAGTAIAAEPQSAPAVDAVASDEWKFSVSPYLWAPALSGKITHRRLPPVDVDASFDKIFDNLDFAAMLMGDARKGRYSIFGDLLYVKVGAQGDTPRVILADSADVKNESFTGMIGAGYSVLDRSEHSLDVVGGLRVWSVDNSIKFNGPLTRGTKYSDSATWVDAMVGVRGTYNFHSRAYLTGWGMIGAGGAQADWDLGLGVGYNFNKSVSATVGYRAMGVDYERNGFKYDVVLQGPIAGLTIRF